MTNLKIVDEVLKRFPKGTVSEVLFEGALIVVYVKDKDIFLRGNEIGKKLAQEFKKRFEIRMDKDMLTSEDYALSFIKNILPEECVLKNIYIERDRSIVVIECQKPEKISEKILEEIKKKTLYIPKLKRAPIKSSKIIDGIRALLHKYSDYRKSFLHRVGKNILVGWELPRRKRNWIRITILGSGREVGRSCILIQTPESNVLLDCGIAVSTFDFNSFPMLDAPEFDIDQLDAVIVSHAHLDHIGLVPFLFKLGWKGPVYLTEPTRDIGALVQLDYIKVCEQNMVNPIFSSNEIREMIKHSITLRYNEVTDITPDIRIALYNAGHIIGSSMIHLNIGNGLHNILYTGDFRFSRSRLLDKPKTVLPRLETLIIESTYGGKNDIHPPREETEKEFIKDIKETLKNKGKVLIPVLAVGRAQEILLTIIDAINRKELPEIPIYLEGILWETTQIHTAYPEFLSKELREDIYNGEDPFSYENLIRASPKDRENIMDSKEPCIIIATSGMMQGGPIVDYFKLGAEDEKNLLAFVSYQAQGTLGRMILDGVKEVRIGNEVVNVKLKVKKYEGFSGHSDHKELMKFVYNLYPKPKNIIIVHGESTKPFELAGSIKGMYNKIFKINPNIYVPWNLDAIRVR